MCIRDRLQAGSPQPARPEVPPSGRAGPSAGHRPVATTVPAGECRSAVDDNDFPCPTLQPVGVSHMPQAVEVAAGVVLLGMLAFESVKCLIFQSSVATGLLIGWPLRSFSPVSLARGASPV